MYRLQRNDGLSRTFSLSENYLRNSEKCHLQFELYCKVQHWLVTKLHNLWSTMVLYLFTVQWHLVPLFRSIWGIILSFGAVLHHHLKVCCFASTWSNSANFVCLSMMSSQKSKKYRKIQDTIKIQENTGKLQKYRNLQDLQDRWDNWHM